MQTFNYFRAQLQSEKILTEAKLQALNHQLTALEQTDDDGEVIAKTPVPASPGRGSKPTTTKGKTNDKKAARSEESEDQEEGFTEEEETFVEETEASDEISDDDIRAAFNAYAKRHTADKAHALLKQYKVKKSTQLSQEQRAKIMEKIG